MPGIFVSYRREDAAGHAGRLFDCLRERFGREGVFMDVAGIEAGVDFVDAIDRAVGSCGVLLAVIGREWLNARDAAGRRRLDDPNDFIRLEIGRALAREVRVIPVLVEGATMPPADALPADVQRLTRRQAAELRDTRWDADVDDLITLLANVLSAKPSAGPPVEEEGAVRPARRRSRGVWIAGALVLAVGVTAVALWQGSFSGGRPEVPGTAAPAAPPAATAPLVTMRVVPDVKSRPLDEALATLGAMGFRVGRVAGRRTSDAPPGTVLEQTPPPGTRADAQTAVDLVLAEPAVRRMVRVVGLPLAEARGILARAGLEPRVAFEETREARPDTVLRQAPGPDAKIADDLRLAKLVVAREPQAVTPPAGPTLYIAATDDAGEQIFPELADFLRRSGIPVSHIAQNRRARYAQGVLLYSREEYRDLAELIAARTGAYLSRAYGRPIAIEVQRETRVAASALILNLPARTPSEPEPAPHAKEIPSSSIKRPAPARSARWYLG